MTWPRWYRSPWPVRLVVAGAALTALGLVIWLVASLTLGARWRQGQLDALAQSVRADSIARDERTLRRIDSMRVLILSDSLDRLATLLQAQDRRRRASADSVRAWQRAYATLAASSTPSETLQVVKRLVVQLVEHVELLEQRVAAGDAMLAAAQARARTFQEGRDRALAALDSTERARRRLHAMLERAEPPCRLCPSRKASFVLGLAADEGLRLLVRQAAR